ERVPVRGRVRASATKTPATARTTAAAAPTDTTQIGNRLVAGDAAGCGASSAFTRDSYSSEVSRSQKGAADCGAVPGLPARPVAGAGEGGSVRVAAAAGRAPGGVSARGAVATRVAAGGATAGTLASVPAAAPPARARAPSSVRRNRVSHLGHDSRLPRSAS